MIPLLEPCTKVTIGFTEDYEGFVTDDVLERPKAIVHLLPDDHKLNSGHETHIVLDRKGVIQQIPTILDGFVEAQYGRPANTIR